jgi:small subunit ribosomal protein S6
MERQMRINEDVLRFMTIRVEAFDEGPTIMMQKRDREERREERRGERRRDRDRDGGEGDDLVIDPIAAAEEVTP